MRQSKEDKERFKYRWYRVVTRYSNGETQTFRVYANSEADAILTAKMRARELTHGATRRDWGHSTMAVPTKD